MFTKEDFLDYFDQILEMEREMKEAFVDLEKRVQHPEYKKIFADFAEEERGHEALVEKMKEPFKK